MGRSNTAVSAAICVESISAWCILHCTIFQFVTFHGLYREGEHRSGTADNAALGPKYGLSPKNNGQRTVMGPGFTIPEKKLRDSRDSRQSGGWANQPLFSPLGRMYYYR